MCLKTCYDHIIDKCCAQVNMTSEISCDTSKNCGVLEDKNQSKSLITRNNTRVLENKNKFFCIDQKSADKNFRINFDDVNF